MLHGIVQRLANVGGAQRETPDFASTSRGMMLATP